MMNITTTAVQRSRAVLSAAMAVTAAFVPSKKATGAVFGADDGGFVYKGAVIGITADTATTIYQGDRPLSELAPKYSYFKAVSDSRLAMVDGMALPYNQKVESVNGTDILVVQFQRFNPRDNRNYCIEACFFQADGAIKAYTRRGFWTKSLRTYLGEDLPALLAAGDTNIKTAPLVGADDTTAGFGLCHFCFSAKTPAPVHPTDISQLNGGFEVRRGTELVIDDGSYATDAAVVGAVKTVDGTLTYRNVNGGFEVRGVDGTDGGELNFAAFCAGGNPSEFNALPFELQGGSGLVATNAPLWAITNVTAVKSGTASGGRPILLKSYFLNVSGDGTTATFNLQGMGTMGSGENNSGLYAFRAKLTQQADGGIVFGNNGSSRFAFVYATNELAKTLAGGTVEPGRFNPFGSNAGCIGAWCTWPGVCAVTNVTLMFDISLNATLYGPNLTPVGGVLRVGGSSGTTARLTVQNATSLPTNGAVFVENGGELVLKPTGAANGHGMAGDSTPIFIRTNGTVSVASGCYHPFGSGRIQDGQVQQVYMDGGKLVGSSSIASGITVSRLYLGRLSMANGAYATGPAHYRIGNGASGPETNFIWHVTGKTPSTFDAGWALGDSPRTGSAPWAHFLLVVDDVTGDGATDFFVGGDTVSDATLWSGKYPSCPVVKTGPGTMELTGTYRTDSVLSIEDGTVLLGADDVFDAGQSVQLAGGTLAVADGKSSAAGTLRLANAGGALVLGDGASIAFADSSAIVWPENAMVEIEGDVKGGSSLRFGTGPSALTSTQKRSLRLNGGHVRLDGDGYVIRSKGACISIR